MCVQTTHKCGLNGVAVDVCEVVCDCPTLPHPSGYATQVVRGVQPGQRPIHLEGDLYRKGHQEANQQRDQKVRLHPLTW